MNPALGTFLGKKLSLKKQSKPSKKKLNKEVSLTHSNKKYQQKFQPWMKSTLQIRNVEKILKMGK